MRKTYGQELREFQMNLLVQALIQAKGNVCKAALSLEIHRNTFARILYGATFMTPGQVCAQLLEQGLLPAHSVTALRQMRQRPQPRYARSKKPAEKLSSSRAA